MTEQGFYPLKREKLREIEQQINKNQEFCDGLAFIHIMTFANHTTGEKIVNKKKVIVKRGQYLTSLSKLAKEFNWKSTYKVRTFLKKLEERKKIKMEITKDYTLITVLNYDCQKQPKTTKINQFTEYANKSTTYQNLEELEQKLLSN